MALVTSGGDTAWHKKYSAFKRHDTELECDDTFHLHVLFVLNSIPKIRNGFSLSSGLLMDFWIDAWQPIYSTQPWTFPGHYIRCFHGLSLVSRWIWCRGRDLMREKDWRCVWTSKQYLFLLPWAEGELLMNLKNSQRTEKGNFILACFQIQSKNT